MASGSIDDVSLPDLQVIQRYSLAVRGATAPRADLIAALEADLAWLTGTGRRRATSSASEGASFAAASAGRGGRPPLAAETPAAKAPAKKTPLKKAAPQQSGRGARRA